MSGRQTVSCGSRDVIHEWASLAPITYREALAMVRAIIGEYGRVTVRQVYYIGSRRGWWEKDYRTKDGREKRNSYKRVSKWLTDMRLRGDVGYDEILEIGRQPREELSFSGAEDYGEYCSTSFQLDLWQYQPIYVEVHVEGEAILPVVDDATTGLRVLVLPNRGNTSTSSIYESAKRLLERTLRHLSTHRPELRDEDGMFSVVDMPKGLVHVLYVGDHDAAGWNMDGNIVERLKRHGRDLHMPGLIDAGVIQFKRIGLTLDQVVKHDLDPDPKPASKQGVGKKYRDHFRDHLLVRKDRQWSFEALPPDIAKQIIREEVERLIDKSAWNRGLALEKAVRAKLASGKAIIG